jgi:uncharacterized protein YaaW (UPF0174 family)
MNATLLQAIRGPVMLITLGVLLAIDQNGPVSFGRTWPVLLIVLGLFKLAEHAGGKSPRGPAQ